MYVIAEVHEAVLVMPGAIMVTPAAFMPAAETKRSPCVAVDVIGSSTLSPLSLFVTVSVAGFLSIVNAAQRAAASPSRLALWQPARRTACNIAHAAAFVYNTS